jgi:hypothetical protein
MTTETAQRTYWRNNKTWHLSTKVYNRSDCDLVIGHMKGPIGGPLYTQPTQNDLVGRKLCKKCFPNGLPTA